MGLAVDVHAVSHVFVGWMGARARSRSWTTALLLHPSMSFLPSPLQIGTLVEGVPTTINGLCFLAGSTSSLFTAHPTYLSAASTGFQRRRLSSAGSVALPAIGTLPVSPPSPALHGGKPAPGAVVDSAAQTSPSGPALSTGPGLAVLTSMSSPTAGVSPAATPLRRTGKISSSLNKLPLVVCSRPYQRMWVADARDGHVALTLNVRLLVDRCAGVSACDCAAWVAMISSV